MKTILNPRNPLLLVFALLTFYFTYSQEEQEGSTLTIERIFMSMDFMPDRFGPSSWIDDGNAYTTLERTVDTNLKGRDIVRYETESGEKSILVPAAMLVPAGKEKPLSVAGYSWSNNKEMLLIYTNTERVWRLNTRGDYWVLNTKTGELFRLGKDLPESSLMFAKFSPDDKKVAYVSKHNLYVEDLETKQYAQITFDGSDKKINGTFDWAYEEELECRDGFRWSPDSKNIAYWQIDATDIKNFLMINNTDSIYSYTIPVQYPKVGETPSSAKIGIIPAEGGNTLWLDIPGDPYQHYLPRMMWFKTSDKVIVQQLNRKQNTNNIWVCSITDGSASNVYTEKEETWTDVVNDWQWLNDGEEFLWVSEKNGWRQLFRVDVNTGKTKIITPGQYDVISVAGIDPEERYVYFIASPDNPTQRYLFRMQMNGKGKPERITPEQQSGWHNYDLAPGTKYAIHNYSNANTPNTTDLVALENHFSLRILAENNNLKKSFNELSRSDMEFFKVITEDGIEIDGAMLKPPGFDPSKKYPVLFYVYGEPWGQTARDIFDFNTLWHILISQNGYIVMTLDNRGTPCPKGTEWRKSIYRKIGVISSHDQAMALKEIIKWDFVDPDRIAVWGWSGGGSMTLNLLFRYPEMYQTGMAVAAVSNQLFYDNIYQERYMGLPSENMEEYIEGSPATHAGNLEGNLLIVHGTGDDNVHYQNAEYLINELIKHNKMFQVMPYPNRSHGIYEGPNTMRHLFTLLLKYLKDHCEPGGKDY